MQLTKVCLEYTIVLNTKQYKTIQSNTQKSWIDFVLLRMCAPFLNNNISYNKE